MRLRETGNSIIKEQDVKSIVNKVFHLQLNNSRFQLLEDYCSITYNTHQRDLLSILEDTRISILIHKFSYRTEEISIIS